MKNVDYKKKIKQNLEYQKEIILQTVWWLVYNIKIKQFTVSGQLCILKLNEKLNLNQRYD